MNSQEKINGQTAACRDAAKLLRSFLPGYSTTQYAFLDNPFASEEARKEYIREIERIAMGLNRRENRLFARLHDRMTNAR